VNQKDRIQLTSKKSPIRLRPSSELMITDKTNKTLTTSTATTTTTTTKIYSIITNLNCKDSVDHCPDLAKRGDCNTYLDYIIFFLRIYTYLNINLINKKNMIKINPYLFIIFISLLFIKFFPIF